MRSCSTSKPLLRYHFLDIDLHNINLYHSELLICVLPFIRYSSPSSNAHSDAWWGHQGYHHVFIVGQISVSVVVAIRDQLQQLGCDCTQTVNWYSPRNPIWVYGCYDSDRVACYSEFVS